MIGGRAVYRSLRQRVGLGLTSSYLHWELLMRYLHTMIRAANLDYTLDFFVDKLGLVEAYRYDNDTGRFTLVFLSAPDDLEGAKARRAPLVEITYNWDPETYDGGRNFGHLAYQVDNILSLIHI